MKTLIIETDFVTRSVLHAILNPYGPSHIAVSGKEVAKAMRTAPENKESYDLMFLDIKMPEMDGRAYLRSICFIMKKMSTLGGRHA